MERIKSVLSGHKKSEDVSHETPATTTATHQEGQTPIYDQMTGPSSAQPTTTGTSTSAGQTGAATNLGHAQPSNTNAPLAAHGTTTGDSSRPDANVRGAGHVHDGISQASIKSGVIGFGTGQGQQHAALSSHNPEATLDGNQVVGGGETGRGPSTAATSEQPSTLKQALPLSGNSTSNQVHNTPSTTSGPGTTTHDSTARQPFEHSLRQESYTKDTDRSFPLAGGVAPKNDPSARYPNEQHSSSTHHPTQHTHHSTTSAREPGTKENEAGVREGHGREGHGREGLAGAAAAATAISAAAPLSQSQQKDVQAQGEETRQATYGDQPPVTSATGLTSNTGSHTTQSHHPQALAAATAAASKSSALSPSAQGQGVDTSASSTQPQGAGVVSGERPSGHRSESYRHIPGGFPSPTPDESKTFLYYRDEVVPEPGDGGPGFSVPRGIHSDHHEAQHPSDSYRNVPLAGGVVGGASSSNEPLGSGKTTAGPHQSDILNKADPRVDSDLDGSRTARGDFANAPTASGATSNVPSGQHELRHTGSLDQPPPRSSVHSDDHHHGRDAAIAGGVGVGVAGLGYASTQKRDTPDVGGANLPQESSPYSSKQLDPRALGSKAKLEEQKYDPQATSTHHTSPSSNVAGVSSSTTDRHGDIGGSDKSSAGPHKSSLLNKLDPRVKGDTSKTTENVSTSPTATKHDEPQSHHGRDAALVGGGAATAVGAHHALQRNDTPGSGTAVIPDQQASRTTDPLSSSMTAAPHQSVNTSAPLSGSTPAASQQSSNAPAPVSSSTTSTTNPSSEPAHAATTGKPYDTYHGPRTTTGSPFYGAIGAPAPVEDNKSSPGKPASALPDTAPTSQQQEKEHHHGRNAGLVGASAATAGGLAYASQHDNKTDSGPASGNIGPHSSNAANVSDPRVQPDPSKQIHHNAGSTTEDPASRTVGPHKSNVGNVMDPRVQPDPAKQKGHTTTGPHQSDTLNRMDPKVDEKAGQQDQHHYGRDAAMVGGSGAAGYGAYEAAKAYGDHRSTGPGASMNEQRYNTGATGAHAPNPVPATSQYDYNNDNTRRNVNSGTGAALGSGAAGGAAYAGSRHGDNTQIPASSNQPLTSSAQPVSSAQSYPTHGSSTTTHGPYDSTQDPRDKDNSKRDAALLGTAGAATAGGAAYAYSQNQDAERERARLEKDQQERLKKEQHDREKEQHKLDKEHAKQEKEAHKLEKEQHKHEKEQHKHDKAVAAHEKEEHKHEREQEKEAHRLEKEREKEAHRLEKEREKEAEPEKKHGILGFLHRDKSKKERSSADNSPRQSGEVRRSTDNTRYSREYDDSNNPDSPRWKGRNLLHKDPPKGHPAREALDHHEMDDMQGGNRTHMGTDGPIGNPNAYSASHDPSKNTYGAQHPSDKVTNSHTGLPMNVGRYGDGHGGTDANPAIHGHQGAGQGVGGTGTDWDAIKKADTPY